MPLKILNRTIGDEAPIYICGEIGINHNGDIDLARKIIDAAVLAGCDAVKMQKRTPELCVPPEQRNLLRETPWGLITYMDYRYKVEFGKDEYAELARYCKSKSIAFFASAWDVPSLDFCVEMEMPAVKIPSAMLTNRELVSRSFESTLTTILSTGMSDQAEVDAAVAKAPVHQVVLCHSVSMYPAKDEDLNLSVISEYRKRYPFVIGYSGHEVGISTSIAAALLGARFIERHITTDRSLWGTDQAASLEPAGIHRLVRDIRAIESAMGSGKKEVLPAEIPIRKKLRGS